ncbi:MAG: Rpn family recombination-promoting nuclease/putative transposase [Verrucomicrobiales bacterium]|nr:Rpn family recombination-promoting nuclease/putative transposase [Verrucomicrobiales bacterium]
MPDETIHQPHDKLFKQSFGDPENAAGFLRHHLPASVAEAIIWERLVLQPGSFVDSHFRQHESDLLFSASIGGGDGLVYLLFEHQVNEDPLIALRLLRYMVRIWESHHKDRPEKPLPVIVPVVLAQNETEWRISDRFSSLLDLPIGLETDLAPFVPDFRFQLVQLAGIPYDALRGTPAGILVLRVMKAERSGQLLSDPVWEESLLQQIPGPVFEMLLRYLLDADVDSEGFHRRLNEISQTELKDSAMTLAQQIRQEGRKEGELEGKLEGRLEGLREAVLDSLAIRFACVPDGMTEAVRKIDSESRLRALHQASLRAESLDAFADNL